MFHSSIKKNALAYYNTTYIYCNFFTAQAKKLMVEEVVTHCRRNVEVDRPQASARLFHLYSKA
jgi:hypothetical protein